MLRIILLAILVILVARAFWRLVDGIFAASGSTQTPRGDAEPAVKLVRDPVCGTYVAPRRALSLTSGGSTHYFCSERCRAEFGSSRQWDTHDHPRR